MSDKNVYYKEFGKRLNKVRKLRGLSQKDIAEFLSIQPATYSRYESGKSKIPLETIRILAKELKVSPDYLMTGKSYNYLEQESQHLTSKEHSLLLQYKELDARGKDNVDTILACEYQYAVKYRERIAENHE